MVEYVGRLTDLVIRLEVGGQESKRFLSDFSYLLNDKKNKDIRWKGERKCWRLKEVVIKLLPELSDYQVLEGRKWAKELIDFLTSKYRSSERTPHKLYSSHMEFFSYSSNISNIKVFENSGVLIWELSNFLKIMYFFYIIFFYYFFKYRLFLKS